MDTYDPTSETGRLLDETLKRKMMDTYDPTSETDHALDVTFKRKREHQEDESVYELDTQSDED